LCRLEWPVRLTQHLPCQQHDIGLPGGDNLFRLYWMRDMADST
jgi:hypothetical protein